MYLHIHTDNAWQAAPNMGSGFARHPDIARLTRRMRISELEANERALTVAVFYETLYGDPESTCGPAPMRPVDCAPGKPTLTAAQQEAVDHNMEGADNAA